MVVQHRSTQRHPIKVVDLEGAQLPLRLRETLAALQSPPPDRPPSSRPPHDLPAAVREGWTLNHKLVQRLWLEEGLQGPTPRERKRAQPADRSVRRHRAQHPHQEWAMESQFEATADGRRLRVLSVNEGHSRLCLAIWWTDAASPRTC